MRKTPQLTLPQTPFKTQLIVEGFWKGQSGQGVSASQTRVCGTCVTFWYSLSISKGGVYTSYQAGPYSESSRHTHNGSLASIIICVGGALLFYFVALMFWVGFRSDGINALLSSIGALIIVPTHWRR
jgi:hypothetical protein